MRFHQLVFSFIFFHFLISCKHEELKKTIQLPNENLEFHSFGLEQMGRKCNKVILKNSKAYNELEKYISELDSLIITDKIDFQPEYTIISDSFKFSINYEKLGIEYINKRNQHLKFIKDIHYNEVFSLGFLDDLSEELIDFGDFYGIGKFKKDIYTFCGLEATPTKYWYKNGLWKFLNKKKILIAEGIFDVLTDTIKGQGGCHYLYKYSKIDTKKWKFYNAKQEQITPTLSLIHHLENLKRIK